MKCASFVMNNRFWRIEYVDPLDPILIDRTDVHTVATTDPSTNRVYLSNDLYGDFLIKVLLHELGHCAMVSYGLIDEIHSMVYPKYWIKAEEWMCNFIADYGFKIFSIAYKTLGDDALWIIPEEFDRLIA